MNRRPTSKDVAALAGVSQATVSYVLNNNPRQSIRPETRDKILAAAKELGYMPNTMAQALRGGRCGCIGVVVSSSILTPRYTLAFQGIRDALGQNGQSLMLCGEHIQENGLPEIINAWLKRSIDAIIYLANNNNEIPAQMLEQIYTHKIPTVALDCMSGDPGISSVCFDYTAGARDAANMLLSDIKNRRLVYIRPEADTLQEQQREQGIVEAVNGCPETDLSYVRLPADITDSSPESMISELEKRLCPLPENAVYICSWNVWADMIIHSLRRNNRRLPLLSLTQDTGISLAELEGWLICSQLPSYEAGCRCVSILAGLMEQPGDVIKTTLQPYLKTLPHF